MQFIGLQGEAVVWGPFLSLCFVFRSSWTGFPESPAQPCSGGRLQARQSVLGHREVALDCGLPERLLPGASVPSGLHAFMAQVRRTGQWSPSCTTSLRTRAGQPLSWAYFPGVQEWGLSVVAPEIKDGMA